MLLPNSASASGPWSHFQKIEIIEPMLRYFAVPVMVTYAVSQTTYTEKKVHEVFPCFNFVAMKTSPKLGGK